jgi:hypothetical protein
MKIQVVKEIVFNPIKIELILENEDDLKSMIDAIESFEKISSKDVVEMLIELKKRK